MKKIFTLAALAAMTISANADVETGFVDATVVGKDATSLEAGTQIASSANVTMSVAYKDNYKQVALAGESDLYNVITIDGTEVPMSGNVGAQGTGNPAPNSAGTLTTDPEDQTWQYFIGGQTSGAVFKFDVAANGYLFVIQKSTYNKNYFAWQGSANLSAAILLSVRHAGAPQTTEGGSAFDYTMPCDEMGYFQDGATASGSETCLEEVIVQKKNGDDKLWEAADGGDPIPAKDQAAADKLETTKKDSKGKAIPFGDHFISLKKLGDLLPTDNFKSGNALSVMAFPVFAETSYYVNACGSKMSSNGFAFIADDEPTMDGLNAIKVSFSKAGETAVAGVAEAKAEVAAPVKVLGANGIQIGNYNIAGQQVK